MILEVKLEVKKNYTCIQPELNQSLLGGTCSQLHLHTLPLCHWGHGIPSQLVLYMSPVAYLGMMFTPKGYRKCYICPGSVFRCEFNGDVRLVIR